MIRAYYIFAYWLAWLVFGVVSVVFNLWFALLLLLPGRRLWSAVARAIMRRFFACWLGWLRWTGLVRVAWHGPDPATLPHPAVCVANHPGLLDAVFILSRLPDAVCVFKPAMLHNPFLAPAAVLAGYTCGGSGTDFVRACVEKVHEGRTLLVFPEGTRTGADVALNPFKPGFALIAERAHVPVQMIVVRASRDLLPRGRPWWHVPRFPTRVDLHVEECFAPQEGHHAHTTADQVEKRFAERLDPAPVAEVRLK
jgi:1-acyl-sn-glycerol-3-phosphate acyltransferase